MPEEVKKNQKPEVEVPQEMPEWAKQLLEQNKKLMEDNTMFREMMGDNKIKSWEHAQKDHTNKFCHFKVLNGRTIIGWSDLNMRMFNPKAADARGENILMTVTYLDGESEEINYSDFVMGKDIVKAKILDFGERFSSIEFEGGQVLSIPTKFLNA